MKRRLLIFVGPLVVLAVAAVAAADVLPPGAIKALPARVGSPSSLAVSASFDQPAGAELQAYNVDIARGFQFDPRAAAGRCTPAQARGATCPVNSEIGSGSGQLSVRSATLAPTKFLIGIAFYMMRPQQPGDLGGLVLAGREPNSGVSFALLGRLVRVATGRYGLELRFSNTASELPAGIQVQLQKVQVHFGTQRTVRVHSGGRVRQVTYHLLTNPSTCPRAGWPFLLTVSYSTGTEHYTTMAACKS